MKAGFGMLMMLAACALPSAARADDPTPAPSAAPHATSTALNFVPPTGWTDVSRPSSRPGIWRDWSIQDGAVTHSIVLSVTRDTARAQAYGDASVAMFRSLPTAKLLESGPATVCGDVPAFAYTYRSDRNPAHPLLIRHVLVDIGPLLGDVSYAHPPDAADRPDALDAMSTFCVREIYAMRAPAGWRRSLLPGLEGKDVPGVEGFTAPSGKSALIALAHADSVRRGAAMLAPAQVRAPTTVVSDAEEQCGTVRVRHAVKRAPGKDGAGPEIMETVAGYRHGATYFYSYVHPEAERADPDAQRALTSFCDPNAALATPLPATTPV
jgi:hypothetical protein